MCFTQKSESLFNVKHADKISSLGSVGSFLDGGASSVLQEATIPFLEPGLVQREMVALQTHFREKRDYMVRRLREMGFVIKAVPTATFYIWLDLYVPPSLVIETCGANFAVVNTFPRGLPTVSTSSRLASRRRLSLCPAFSLISTPRAVVISSTALATTLSAFPTGQRWKL